MVKVTNWCALAIGSASAGGATIQPTFQPVIEKILPAEPTFTTRSAMPGKAASEGRTRPVEEQMLPDLVRQDQRVGAARRRGEQSELLVAEHPAGRVMRIVEHDQAGARGEGLGKSGLGDPPVGRGEPHQPRHAAGAQHQGQIGVVERLDQHDLVARRDQGEQARGQGLGRARGDDHLRGRRSQGPGGARNGRRLPRAARAARASADIGSSLGSAPPPPWR